MKRILLALLLISITYLHLVAQEYVFDTHADSTFSSTESDGQKITFLDIENQLTRLSKMIDGGRLSARAEKLISSECTSMIEMFSVSGIYHIYERFKRDVTMQQRFPLCYKYLFNIPAAQKKRNIFSSDPYPYIIEEYLETATDINELEEQLADLEINFKQSNLDVKDLGPIFQWFLQALGNAASLTYGQEPNLPLYLCREYIKRTPGCKKKYPILYKFLNENPYPQGLINDFLKDPYSFTVVDDEALDNFFN